MKAFEEVSDNTRTLFKKKQNKTKNDSLFVGWVEEEKDLEARRPVNRLLQ